jgi:hypothetical protein
VYGISRPIILNPKIRNAPPSRMKPKNTPSAKTISPAAKGRLLAPLIFCINFAIELILLFD